MATSKKITPEQAMQDLAARKHHIDADTAATMVKKFKSFRTKMTSAKKNSGALPANVPDLPAFVTYNKKVIQKLLKDPACTGLRIYPAINASNSLTFVLVGVDESGENILDTAVSATANAMVKPAGGTTVDEGQTSPPYPAPSNGF